MPGPGQHPWVRLLSPILLMLAALLLRVSSEGQQLAWARQFACLNETYGTGIATDASGNVYTSGYFNGTADLDPGPAVFNFSQPSGAGTYISKLDANGNFVWAKQFVGWNLIIYAMALDADGNIYTTGFYQRQADFDPGPALLEFDAGSMGCATFISKLDKDGNFVWAKQLANIGNVYLTPYDIHLDPTNNILITGTFSGGPADFDPGPGTKIMTSNIGSLGDIYTVKLDNNGELLWVNTMSGPSHEEGYAISSDASGNIYSAGTFKGTLDFNSGPGVFNMSATVVDGYICKWDPGGNLVWAKQLSGSLAHMHISAMTTDAAGNSYLTGMFSTSVDFDPGPGVMNLTAIDIDLFMLKLNSIGELVWVKQIGGPLHQRGHSIYLDKADNLYLAGDYEGTTDLDPGPSNHVISSAGEADFFISRFDVNGGLVWSSTWGGSEYDLLYDIYADPLHNVYATGYFHSVVDFDPEPAVQNLDAGISHDAFVLKLGHCDNPTSAALNVSTCGSYALNSQIYTQSGTFTQVLINASGCDSIITLQLILGGSVHEDVVTACNSYWWEGVLRTSSGLYSQTFMDRVGCDSVRKLSLTLYQHQSVEVNQSICEGESFEGHTDAGVYVQHLQSMNGCDSTRTVNLTIQSKARSSVVQTICEGELWEGYGSSGTFVDTFLGSNGCDSIRTLELTVNPREFTIINASICEGESYFAEGADQRLSGSYKDTLLSALGCDSIITTILTVRPLPTPDLGQDRDICSGTTILLFPGAYLSYAWQDQSSGSNLAVTQTGKYWVTVSDGKCLGADTVEILQTVPVPSGFLKEADSVCSYDHLTILPNRIFNGYEWSNGSIAPTISIMAPGEYWLTVTDRDGCEGSDTIMVYPKGCPAGVFIPGAFSPNGDGKNDVFRPMVYGRALSYRFEVYDRNGLLQFRSTDAAKGWDGRFKGKMNSTAVFVWFCSFQLEGGKPEIRKGVVVLVQ